MTTQANASSTRHGGSRALVAAGLTAVAAGLVLAAVGALTAGASAAYGALAGTGFVVVILGLGTAAVHVVANALPAASLIVALMTYTLQIVLMALVFVVLGTSGVLDDALDREWFAGAVIAGTALWLIGQIRVATKARIPAYDLTETGGR